MIRPHHRTPVPLGIDLGTTNSAVAIVSPAGRTELLTSELGERLIPSVVYLSDEGIVVGREALKALALDPEGVAESPKRDMGATRYHAPVRGQWFPPEVLQAGILRELRQMADRAIGKGHPAIISVPAYFDDIRRRATTLAAEMAELPVRELVNEPTAAALAFGEYHGYLNASGAPAETLRLLVYDLGGGTFDVTLIELAPHSVRTLATDGDVKLGGRDWDQRLLDYLVQKFEGRFRQDPRDDPAAMARLRRVAQDARESLSSRHSVTIPIEFADARRDVPVTQSQLELLTEDLLERTAHTTTELLRQCQCPWNRLDRILLAGGATRMPMVQRMIRKLSGRIPDQTVNPDEAIARGAAIYAAFRLGQADGNFSPLRVRVVDVSTHSLGMEGVDLATGRKENRILIPRNTPLPTSVIEHFTTRWDDQTSIVVKILEGENPEPTSCVTIGHAILDRLPVGLRKGHPVQVIYELAQDGQLQVRLRVPGIAREMILDIQRANHGLEDTLPGWKAALRGEGRFATFEDMVRQVLDVRMEHAQGGPPRGQGPTRGDLAMKPFDPPTPPWG